MQRSPFGDVFFPLYDVFLHFARVLSKGANEECYKAAKDALNGSNPIGKCLFFNTGYGKGFRLGGHQFY